MVPLIGQANAALARYDGLVAAVPNAGVLLSPLTMREAVLSSRIEGTIVTMSEALEIEAGAGDGIGQPKRDDAEEVWNYRRALVSAAQAVKERSLSLHLLRGAHMLLMQGVRGRDMSPGAFRNEQNWIGPPGCSIDQASFVPIPQEHLLSGLDRWVDYVQSRTEPDPLVQLAVIHAEFEALHPFKDGNGRLGRMIIPLFLYERGVLCGPNFYMSAYLETHREQYVDKMQAVSATGDWTEWCSFFLEGLIEQASENQAKARAVVDLHARMQREVAEVTRSRFSNLAVDFIFSRPVFSTTGFIDESGIPRQTAFRMLRALVGERAQMLKLLRKNSGSRAAMFCFPELIDIFG